jgi:hypothetical protein
MVVHTAEELAEDLEGPAVQAAAPPSASAPAAAGEPGDGADLLHRVATLEMQVARQRRVFRRLMDVLGGAGD